MITVLLALAAQAPIAASETNQPDISGPVKSYVNCIADRAARDRRMKTANAALIRAIHLKARAACADTRRLAMTEVDRILGKEPSHQDPAARAALVNKVFLGVDHRLDEIDAALQDLENIRNNFSRRN